MYSMRGLPGILRESVGMNEGNGERMSNLKWMEREWSGVGVVPGG